MNGRITPDARHTSRKRRIRRLLMAATAAVAVLDVFLLAVIVRQKLQRDRPDPFARVEESEDVGWLEKIAGSLAAAAELEPTGGLARNAKDLRTAAYARLGSLGTEEGLSAIRRLEAKAKRVVPCPDTVRLGVWTHPCFHFEDSTIEPIATVTGEGGVTYALVGSSVLGRRRLFLVSSKTPKDDGSWTRPKLTRARACWRYREAELALEEGGVLAFSFVPGRTGATDAAPVRRERNLIRLEEVLADSDRDGWTDLEEGRLGLDPSDPDSDGDGIPDGRDPCPDYAPSKDDEGDEEVLMIQKALFATFGLSGSRHLLLVEKGSRRVQLWGYGGPVMYEHERRGWSPDGVLVWWTVEKVTPRRASVTIHDYEGPLAAGEQKVILRKIGDAWIVVECKWLSVS